MDSLRPPWSRWPQLLAAALVALLAGAAFWYGIAQAQTPGQSAPAGDDIGAFTHCTGEQITLGKPAAVSVLTRDASDLPMALRLTAPTLLADGSRPIPLDGADVALEEMAGEGSERASLQVLRATRPSGDTIELTYDLTADDTDAVAVLTQIAGFCPRADKGAE